MVNDGHEIGVQTLGLHTLDEREKRDENKVCCSFRDPYRVQQSLSGETWPMHHTFPGGRFVSFFSALCGIFTVARVSSRNILFSVIHSARPNIKAVRCSLWECHGTVHHHCAHTANDFRIHVYVMATSQLV